jgi:hypothetical protein
LTQLNALTDCFHFLNYTLLRERFVGIEKLIWGKEKPANINALEFLHLPTVSIFCGGDECCQRGLTIRFACTTNQNWVAAEPRRLDKARDSRRQAAYESLCRRDQLLS